MSWIGTLSRRFVETVKELPGAWTQTAMRLRERRASGQQAASSTQFEPWFDPAHFADTFRGKATELAERYADLADRLIGFDPAVDVGCGRGEFVELLLARGMDARGIDLDERIIESAVARGLPLEGDDAIQWLRNQPDDSLGAVAALQFVEHLTPQQLLDFVALTAAKVRPGGLVLAETPNPQSLVVFAAALYADPTHTTPIHPDYLSFLFQEAGFRDVTVELRSHVPAGTKLPHCDPPTDANYEAFVAGVNHVVDRLNDLLYGPQDYAIVAVR